MTSNVTFNITLGDEVMRLSESEFTVCGVFLTLLGALSFSANAIVILVLLKGNIKYHPVHKMLLLNITVSDLLVAPVACSMASASSFANRWMFSETACTFEGFWVFLLSLGDMNAMVVIAVCRYIIVCKPQFESRLKNWHTKAFLLVVIWGHALVITSVPLFGISGYHVSPLPSTCTIDWTNDSLSAKAYNICLIIMCYCVHVGILTFCYSNIIYKLWIDASGNAHPVHDNDKSTSDQTTRPETKEQQEKMTATKAVTMNSLSMVMAYLFAWTPYALASLYVMVWKTGPKWLLVLPTLFAKSGILLNPITCALLSGNFRDAIKQFFRRKRVSPSSSDQNEMNQACSYSGRPQ